MGISRAHLKAASLVTLTAFSLTACLAPGSRRDGGRDDGGGDGAVLASIGGVSDADMNRPKVGFWLACDGTAKIKGEAKKEGDKEFVRFVGNGLEGVTCAMEIRDDDAKADPNYEWFGVSAGKKEEGLLYASNKDKVKDKKLTLKLYKLYSVKPQPTVETFSVDAEVTLTLADGVAMPEAAKSAANLFCGTDTFVGTFKKATGANDATLVFADKFEVQKMKGRTCERVVVLVDNKPAYQGETAGMKFDAPKKGDQLTFPGEAGKRYALAAIVDDTVTVDATGEGACLNFVDNKCLDRREIKFSAAKTIFLAKVKGKRDGGEGALATYFVAGSEKGLGAYEGGELTTKMLNDHLKKDADRTTATRFNWYKVTLDAELDAKVLGASFDQAMVTGDALAAYKIAREDLSDFLVLDISDAYVHGAKTIDEKDLNTKSAARWLAMVKATKDARVVEFIVTGHDKFFSSAAAPATVDGKKVFFDFKTLASEMETAAGTDKWRGYAFKGATFVAPETCTLERGFYVDTVSLMHAGELKEGSGVAKSIDDCEVEKSAWKAELKDYKIELTFYDWAWHKLTN